MRRVLLVYVGGGVGAVLRAVLLALLAPWDRLFPVSVLVVNLLGAFALGGVVVLADEAGLLRAETRLFLAVGVLGGFTTFSTFAWGADTLIGHQAGAAAIYVGASVGGGVLAVALGLTAAREAVGLLEGAAIGVLQRLNARRLHRHSQVRLDIDGAVGNVEAEDREDDASEGKEKSA